MLRVGPTSRAQKLCRRVLGSWAGWSADLRQKAHRCAALAARSSPRRHWHAYCVGYQQRNVDKRQAPPPPRLASASSASHRLPKPHAQLHSARPASIDRPLAILPPRSCSVRWPTGGFGWPTSSSKRGALPTARRQWFTPHQLTSTIQGSWPPPPASTRPPLHCSDSLRAGGEPPRATSVEAPAFTRSCARPRRGAQSRWRGAIWGGVLPCGGVQHEPHCSSTTSSAQRPSYGENRHLRHGWRGWCHRAAEAAEYKRKAYLLVSNHRGARC